MYSDNKGLTDNLGVYRDLEKLMVVYDSPKRSIVDQLLAFKKDKCGKYIDITRKFLSNPDFLKLAYYSIKNNKRMRATLNDITDEWFSKTANQIKQAQYKFKTARHIKLPGNFGKRKLVINNSRDEIIQKALEIILELVYERGGIFLDVSHGFRPSRSHHSLFKQIKFK